MIRKFGKLLLAATLELRSPKQTRLCMENCSWRVSQAR